MARMNLPERYLFKLLFLLGFSSSFRVFHGFCDELYYFVIYIVHFQTFYYSRFQGHIVDLSVFNPCHGYTFLPCFSLFTYVFFIYIVGHLSLFPCDIYSVLPHIVRGVQASYRFLYSVRLGFFTS